MTDSHPRWAARSIGAAPRAVLERARTEGEQNGSVLGSFGYGHYVRFGTTIFAVGQERIHPGPLHLLYGGTVPKLRPGSSITMSADRLWTPGLDLDVDLRRAARWNPRHPGPRAFNASLPVLERICYRTPPDDLDLDWRAVERLAADNELMQLRLLLEGRGPGLTPAGDDVLAGVLLLHALARPEDTQLPSIADGTATTDLSRGFLSWASRGHSIEPVHGLIRQAGSGLEEAAEQTAANIASVGASSGGALLFGLGLAARTLQRADEVRTGRPTRAIGYDICPRL